MQRTIDAHIHLSERKDDALLTYAKNNGLRYSLSELMGLMRKNSVQRGLLLSPPLEDGRPLPNQQIIELCKRSEGMLSPVVTVEPTKKEVAAALRTADENSEVKAFKIRLGYVRAAADSHVFDPVYDYAQAKGLPVLYHTGDTAFSTGDLRLSHPLSLDSVANRREELKIVLCHFGSPWFEDVAELIYKHPNAYADISGLTTGGGAYAKEFVGLLARKLSEAIYFAGGAEKILFGTDYPVTTYSDAFALVRLLQVDDSDKEMILWRNAKEVFRL